MTTPIKFRGFRTDGKGWVEGLPNQYQGTLRICREIIEHPSHSDPAGVWIYQEHEIHPSSLGMFTGQTDKNGKEIFGAIGEKGGDVVRVACGYVSYIAFKDAMFVSVYTHPEDGEELPLLDILGFKNNTEIIGNQFEQE